MEAEVEAEVVAELRRRSGGGRERGRGAPMPEMIVWLLSSSVCTRKVGSSLVNRPSALPKPAELRSLGMSASETTGSGTCIEVIE
jgi:hypothetical protein